MIFAHRIHILKHVRHFFCCATSSEQTFSPFPPSNIEYLCFCVLQSPVGNTSQSLSSSLWSSSIYGTKFCVCRSCGIYSILRTPVSDLPCFCPNRHHYLNQCSWLFFWCALFGNGWGCAPCTDKQLLNKLFPTLRCSQGWCSKNKVMPPHKANIMLDGLIYILCVVCVCYALDLLKE